MYWIYLSIIKIKFYLSSLIKAWQNFWSDFFYDYVDCYYDYFDCYDDSPHVNLDTNSDKHPLFRRNKTKDHNIDEEE
jgi:hypothetical protein